MSDLSAHECLGFLRAGRPRPWILTRGEETIEFAPRGRFATDNAEAVLDAAVRGLGLVCLLDFMVKRDVEAGRLSTVLDHECAESRPLYALQPFHRHPSAKVRAFVDFLVEALARASPRPRRSR